MRASWARSSSRILRTSNRTVLRSSTNSTSSVSARASVTTWASLLTLSRLSRTNALSSQHSFVFLHQLALHLAKHLLVIGSRLLHLLGVSLQNDAHLVIDAVFK